MELPFNFALDVPPINAKVFSLRNCTLGPITVYSIAGPSLPINFEPF